MRKSALIASLALAGVITLPSTAGFAHHAVQNQFITSDEGLLQKRGTLVKVDWINPHAWFHFAEVDADGNPVIGPDGRQVVWSTETTGPNGLRRAGIADRRLFQVGELYTFSGYVSRTYVQETGEGDTTMFTNEIILPDGRAIGIATFQDASTLGTL